MMRTMHLRPLSPVKQTLITFVCCVMLFLSLPAPPVAADTTVGGTISTDATWTVSGSPYIVTSNITVQGIDGADGITTLTIEPGVVIRFNSNLYMNIGSNSGDPGALIAQGTSSASIVFTSNQSTPSPGDWNCIRFHNTADDATSIMEHCAVEYSGNNYSSIYLFRASPTLRNVTVQNSKSCGVYAYYSESTIENCTFTGSQDYDLKYTGTAGGSVTGCTINSGISLLATGAVTFSGNTINQNNAFPIKAYADHVGAISSSSFVDVDAASYLEVSASTITRDATWTAAIPYVITSNLTVQGADGADGITTLTVEPGAVIRFNSNLYMNIGSNSGDPGALIAQGTSSASIVFTSNQSTPSPGDWNYIRFHNTSDDATSILDHCVIKYGGYGAASVYLYQASPTIQNSTIRYSKNSGIYAYGSNSGSTIINCNSFNGNKNGVFWAASPPQEMHDNNFEGNTDYGLYYSGSQMLDAENNWWGDGAGPNQSGDGTYGNVDADPWSSAENHCVLPGENNPPYEPTSPAPGDGAVRVDISNGVDLVWTGGGSGCPGYSGL